MNDLTPLAHETTLPAMIDRAAASIASARSAAEILEARDLAGLAYDMAKRAARLSGAKDAHDTLIAKAHRYQADALEIEARAKRRLADEYDAAQERGEVASGSVRTDIVPGENDVRPATAADIGLTRKDIHEARQFRDAERADPGIVRRVLDDRLANREEPTKTALRQAVIEAAQQGLRGGGFSTPSRKNPFYRPNPTRDALNAVIDACERVAEIASQYSGADLLSTCVDDAERRRDSAAIARGFDALSKLSQEIRPHA